MEQASVIIDYQTFLVGEGLTMKLVNRTMKISSAPIKNGQSLPRNTNTYPLHAGPRARANVETERLIPSIDP